MKKITKIFLIIAVIALLVLTACEPGDDEKTRGRGKQADRGEGFVGGTNGVVMEFVEDAPPAEVYDNSQDEFDIAIQLQNDGEWDVTSGNVQILLKGLGPEFTLSNPLASPASDLEGKRLVEGEIVPSASVEVVYPSVKYAREITGSQIAVPIQAEMCYSYGTNAVTDVCIRENLRSTEKNPICEVNEAKTVENSGAPVQVTSFKEVPAGTDKVALIFTISNTQDDDAHRVFKKESQCDEVNRANLNKVYVELEATDLSGITCTGLRDGGATSGYVTLKDGEKTITCTKKITENTDFVTYVNIKLEYDYQQILQQDLVVKNSGIGS